MIEGIYQDISIFAMIGKSKDEPEGEYICRILLMFRGDNDFEQILTDCQAEALATELLKAVEIVRAQA